MYYIDAGATTADNDDDDANFVDDKSQDERTLLKKLH